MARINKKVGYHPVGAATSYVKDEAGKSSLNAAQHCVKAHDGDKWNKLREGWAFRISTLLHFIVLLYFILVNPA